MKTTLPLQTLQYGLYHVLCVYIHSMYSVQNTLSMSYYLYSGSTCPGMPWSVGHWCMLKTLLHHVDLTTDLECYCGVGQANLGKSLVGPAVWGDV